MKFKLKNERSHECQYTKHATPPTVAIHNFTVFSFEVLRGPLTVNYGYSGESLHLLTLTSGWKRWQETCGAQRGHGAPTLLSRQSDLKNVICNLSTCFFLKKQYIFHISL